MVLADSLSPMGLYGNYKVFRKRLEEGYTQLALGFGPEVEGQFLSSRVVGMVAFFHPDGRIATLETWKYYGLESKPVRGSGEEVYTRRGFKDFKSRMKISLSRRSSLEKVCEEWEGIKFLNGEQITFTRTGQSAANRRDGE